MSSRVEAENRARDAEQKRLAERLDKQKTNESREKFAKAMNRQKGEKDDGVRHQKLSQGGQVKKGTARQAHNALLAKSGMLSQNKFQAMLQTSGQQSIKQTKTESHARTDDLKESQAKVHESESETSRLEMDQNDKLAAIDGEARRGGGGMGGDGNLDSEAGDNQRGQGAGIQGAAAASDPQAAAEVRGARVPQLPPEVIKQIVDRVMVGVSEEGLNTFVTQLKDDVLSGASLQINAKDGKISAKFKTTDKNTGRLLKASEGALSRVFAQKGMSLESFAVETS